jgi:hypothetical protein
LAGKKFWTTGKSAVVTPAIAFSSTIRRIELMGFTFAGLSNFARGW